MKYFLNAVGGLCTLLQVAGTLPGHGQAAITPVAGGGPGLRFSETVFDFGKVISSELLRHDFIVTNTGNIMLEIKDVRPGCPGCTTALPWDRQIEPGKTGKIPIQFNPASFSGSVSKGVTVTTSDPVQPVQSLQIQATIWRPIDVQPAYVYFMPIEGEETNETKVVRIRNQLDEPLTLERPQCNNPAFEMELKTSQPGKEFELQVKYVKPAGPVTNAMPQSVITIKTSSTNMPLITLTAGAMAQPAIVAMPSQINLPAGPLAAGHRHSQMIRNNGHVPLTLTNATVNAEGVTVQITESQPGKLFMLSVNFPTNFQVRAGQPLELTINTSNPRRPVVHVPIVVGPTRPASPLLGRPQRPAPTPISK